MFHFTGQLDAYSEKQFLSYVTDVLKANASPTVLDLSKIDFDKVEHKAVTVFGKTDYREFKFE